MILNSIHQPVGIGGHSRNDDGDDVSQTMWNRVSQDKAVWMRYVQSIRRIIPPTPSSNTILSPYAALCEFAVPLKLPYRDCGRCKRYRPGENVSPASSKNSTFCSMHHFHSFIIVSIIYHHKTNISATHKYDRARRCDAHPMDIIQKQMCASFALCVTCKMCCVRHSTHIGQF